LSYNLITGAIHYNTGVLVTEGRQESALKFFDIEYNPITGVFPVAGFTSLVNVSLSFTDISGSLPDEIGLLSNLESISLMGNVMLSGTLPSTLALLTMLKNLSLSFTDFTGTLPETIGSMTNLGELTCIQAKFQIFLLNLCHPSPYCNK
jgi:Leucine-rich repeat (LRR) protein